MTEIPPKLRVLVIDEYFPSPPDSGKPIRTWNLLRRLSEQHEVTLLCYGNASEIQAPPSPLHSEFVAPLVPYAGFGLYARLAANLLSPYPYSVAKHYTRRFRERMSALLCEQAFDLIQCEWTP